MVRKRDEKASSPAWAVLPSLLSAVRLPLMTAAAFHTFTPTHREDGLKYFNDT
jgi:hypothetical protein